MSLNLSPDDRHIRNLILQKWKKLLINGHDNFMYLAMFSAF